MFHFSDASNFQAFFNYSEMRTLLDNFSVFHVNAPGQEEGAATLPEKWVFELLLSFLYKFLRKSVPIYFIHFVFVLHIVPFLHLFFMRKFLICETRSVTKKKKIQKMMYEADLLIELVVSGMSLSRESLTPGN